MVKSRFICGVEFLIQVNLSDVISGSPREPHPSLLISLISATASAVDAVL
jgi:hypothetical protein